MGGERVSNPCHPWFSAAFLIRVYSCPFVVRPKSGAKSPHSVKERGSHGAFTLQSASRETRAIRGIRGSLCFDWCPLVSTCSRKPSEFVVRRLRMAAGNVAAGAKESDVDFFERRGIKFFYRD